MDLRQALLAFLAAVVVLGVPLALLGAESLTNIYVGDRSSHGGAFDMHYDLASLRASSTEIVFGRVTGLESSYGSSGSRIVQTVFKFNIVVYDKGAGPDTIYVVDTGGVFNNVRFDVPGSPLLTVSGEYVLFLSSNWNCAPPPPPCALPPTPLETTYGIVGGAQGKFLVLDNKVYGYKTLFPQENYAFGFDANGMPLDQFLAQV